MAGLNQIEYIVGIDLGTTISGVSIAHVNDPLNIITVSAWDDSKEPSKTFFSSILYSKDGNDTPKCGMQRDEVGDLGVYVDNISQYLLDIDASNKKLGQLMDGLTVKKVMTDYLKYFVQIALKRLQVHDKLIENKHFQDFVNEEFIYEDIITVCYCFVCPTDRQEFMKDCFIGAGIIEASEAEHRLSFVIKAVTIAHYHLSLNRNETNIQKDQDYFVVDVDDISSGIAKVHPASTRSLSTVTKISDDATQGSLNLEIRFKDYLIENMIELNLDASLIDQFIQTFSEEIKYEFNMDTPTKTAISQKNVDGNLIEFTYEDLNRIVIYPFIEGIHEFVSKANETHGQHKMFLSANGGISEYFVENLIARDKGRLKYYHTKGVSSGAVSSKISTYKSQIPFFFNDEHQPLFSDKKWPFRKTTIEEPTDNNNENDAYDFIFGIDIGTSFSGCSYVQLKDKNGKPGDTKKIKTIKIGWPGGKILGSRKSPTLSMYNEELRVIYWSLEPGLNVNRHQAFKLLGNFKLFLCPESLENFHGHTVDLEERKRQEGFADERTTKNEVDTVEVIADYLKQFKDHIAEYILTKEMGKKFHFFIRGILLREYKMRYVIAVPAMWNLPARNAMAQAAIEATLIKKDEIDQLLIISEPEAAALFCMKSMTEYFEKEDEELNDTNFIVCDAGGGIVDLVTFNLQLNKEDGDTPTTKPIIRQIGDSIGDICGSTCIDLRFKKYLLEFYKSVGVDIDKENIPIEDVMESFVNDYKPRFLSNLQDNTYYHINLPKNRVLNFTRDSTFTMVNENKTLKMKNQDVKEKIFDPIVDRIIYLMDDQLNQAKKGGRDIKAILMVGGFSQSKYLQQRIKDQYKGVCHVIVPVEGDTAISRGAVSYALNPRTISRNIVGKSIGLEVQAPFGQRKDKSPDGSENFEKYRLEYFVKDQALGDELKTVYKKDIHVLYPNAAVIAIFACDSKKDVNNRYLTKSHVKIGEEKIIMPPMVGIDGKLIHFTVSLHKEHDGVSVTIECQDQLINAEVKKNTKHQRSSLKVESKYLYVARTKRPLVSYSLEKSGSLFKYGRLSA